MRIRAVLFVLSNLLAIIGAAQTIPLLAALVLDDRGMERIGDLLGFSASIIVALAVGLSGRRLLRGHA